MKATNREPEIVTRNGKPVSVILPIKEYQELLERAEDAEDVAWLKRARGKKLHYRPLGPFPLASARNVARRSSRPTLVVNLQLSSKTSGARQSKKL